MNYEAIRVAIHKELADPQKLYMPNSPGAYVRDRLFKDCEWEAAVWFWGCYCRGNFGIFELDELLPQLNALASKESMPDWGTNGT